MVRLACRAAAKHSGLSDDHVLAILVDNWNRPADTDAGTIPQSVEYMFAMALLELNKRTTLTDDELLEIEKSDPIADHNLSTALRTIYDDANRTARGIDATLKRYARAMGRPQAEVRAEYERLRADCPPRDAPLTQSERHVFGQGVPDFATVHALRRLELSLPISRSKAGSRCAGCGAPVEVGHACGAALTHEPVSVADWAFEHREKPGLVVRVPPAAAVAEVLETATRPVLVPVAAQLRDRRSVPIVSGDFAAALANGSGDVVLRPSAVTCSCGDTTNYFCRHIRRVAEEVRQPLSAEVARRNDAIGRHAAAIKGKVERVQATTRSPAAPPVAPGVVSYLDDPEAFTAAAGEAWERIHTTGSALPERLPDLAELPARTVGHEFENELEADPRNLDCGKNFKEQFDSARDDACVREYLDRIHAAGYIGGPFLWHPEALRKRGYSKGSYDWAVAFDGSLVHGVETISPITDPRNAVIWDVVEEICEILEDSGAYAHPYAAHHLWVGAPDYQGNPESLSNLLRVTSRFAPLLRRIGSEVDVPGILGSARDLPEFPATGYLSAAHAHLFHTRQTHRYSPGQTRRTVKNLLLNVERVGDDPAEASAAAIEIRPWLGTTDVAAIQARTVVGVGLVEHGKNITADDLPILRRFHRGTHELLPDEKGFANQLEELRFLIDVTVPHPRLKPLAVALWMRGHSRAQDPPGHRRPLPKASLQRSAQTRRATRARPTR